LEVAVPALRPDETYHRLLFWTYDQALSERLAGHLLAAEGYESLDPSCPLGGPDQGADALCLKSGKKWVMASYFPYGPKSFTEIKKKLTLDLAGAQHREPYGVAFVCNQKLTPTQKKKLQAIGGDIEIDLFHLERNVHILDRSQMAQIREQYVYIPAAGRPPIAVRAEVIGAARAFTDDDWVLDFFVDCYEKDVREESDKAWARVKAEEEAKARARSERARREREDALAARAGDLAKPYGFKLPSIDYSGFLPDFPKIDLGGQLSQQYGFATKDAPEPPKPLTDEEIDRLVSEYRADLLARWDSCKDYLAGVVSPGTVIQLHNDGGYLSNVQVVLRFHGAVGVDFDLIQHFDYRKLENPSWEARPAGPPWLSPVTQPPSLRPKDYPVKVGHNDNGDLEVTITLSELRPRQVWRSDDEDFVLVLRDADLDEVEVTHWVTAADYHEAFDGDPIVVPVDRVSMWDAFREAFEASDKA